MPRAIEPAEWMIRVRWGARIRHHRQGLKLEQAELAERLGLSQQQLSTWENGRSAPPPTVWVQLADELGLPWESLFDPEPHDEEVA